MELKAFIDKLKSEDLWLSGEATGKIDFLSSDSRELKTSPHPSILFFARKGLATDGHRYLPTIQSQAKVVAFVVETIPDGFESQKPVIVVRDSRKAMALACKIFYGDPSKDLFCSAVTGTNGKTTTSFLVSHFLNSVGKKTALVGTIKTSFEGEEWASTMTTPDFSVLQKQFADFKKKGAVAVSFEASSHALHQGRLEGLELDAAIFTNLSPEHLDYHSNMEDYFQAKKKLFSKYLVASLKPRKVAILPLDGGYGTRMAEELQSEHRLEIWPWSFKKQSGHENLVWIKDFSSDLKGSSLEWVWKDQSYQCQARLIGEFNVENLAGVICLGLSMGISPEPIQKAISNFDGVPGRLERVCEDLGNFFVDYAHTPDAIENVLSTLRPMTSGRLRVVFGCGGDRDKGKRPRMGEIAELFADEIFVTSDNPRTENPTKIMNEILSGMQRIKRTEVEADRKKAIEWALQDLEEGDVVLVAGKGHETYQIIGDKKIEFDDRHVIKSYLKG